MITIRALVLLLALYFSLNAWCQAPPKSAPAASQPAPGAFVDVEAGKLYYEECGTGPDAVILIHDGIAHSAVWDDVWGTFCKRFHMPRLRKCEQFPALREKRCSRRPRQLGQTQVPARARP
jgi:hypothetical protein